MALIKSLWTKWKNIAHRIGVFQSRVLLSLFYFAVLLPLGIFFTLFKDKLKIKTKRQSTWIGKDRQTQTLEEIRKQY